MEIGSAIKLIRKTRNINQKDLAAMSGLSQNGLNVIEKDKVMPQKQTIDKICKALGITSGFLLFSCLTEEDIPEDKRLIFRIFHKAITENVFPDDY